MYTTVDYQDVSRRWSALALIRAKLAPTLAWDVTDWRNSRFHVVKPAQHLAVSDVQFVLRWDRDAVESRAPLRRRIGYQLLVTMPSLSGAGVELVPDVEIAVWKERLIYFLDGLRVPFLDYREPASLKAYVSGDFTLEFESASPLSEEDANEVNGLIVRMSTVVG